MSQSQKPFKGSSGGKGASKAKKGTAANKHAEDDREETLQAVV